MLIERLPKDPNQNADALLLAVADNLGEIDVRIVVKDVTGGCRPTFVQQDVLQSIVGGKVDEVFIGAGVHAGSEVDAGQINAVPPVPRHFAWLDPRSVFDCQWCGKLVDQFRLQQVGIVLGRQSLPAKGTCVSLSVLARYGAALVTGTLRSSLASVSSG